MDAASLTRWRMRSLGLTGPRQESPDVVAAHLLAVQSQDHGPACWAIGQRTRSPSADAVSTAFDRGDLVRLHVLRPTWHTVAADDVGWLVALTGPRVERANGGAYRSEGLTPEVLARAREQIGALLDDGTARTRLEVGELVGMTGRRLGHLMIHLELTGLVCSGPVRGTAHSYGLVSHRAPHARVLDRDEALAELATRYARSHGPVTPHDLSTWATLLVTECRQAMEAADLARVDVEGVTHFHAPEQSPPRRGSQPRWRLLQLYDELVVGYRHSGHVLGTEARTLAQKRSEPQAIVLRDEQVVGRWRRTGSRVEVLLREGSRSDVIPAVEEHARFLGLPLDLVLL